jgi:hypothetical protein
MLPHSVHPAWLKSYTSQEQQHPASDDDDGQNAAFLLDAPDGAPFAPYRALSAAVVVTMGPT